MKWFTKKPVVEFACYVEGLEQIMPIIPAKKYKHPWLVRAFQHYSRIKKESGYGEKQGAHITQCPGILSIMHHGWILRAWQDIVIDTNKDGLSYSWQTPFNEEQAHGIQSVQSHNPSELVNFFEHWSSPTPYIFKLNFAWHCKIPKGYALLTLPVAYADEDRFETVPGMLSDEYEWTALNPQIKWKAPPGKSLIKAGTPLAQFILVKMDDVEAKVFYDRNLLSKVQVNSMFVRSRFVQTARSVKDFLKGKNK